MSSLIPMYVTNYPEIRNRVPMNPHSTASVVEIQFGNGFQVFTPSNQLGVCDAGDCCNQAEITVWDDVLCEDRAVCGRHIEVFI